MATHGLDLGQTGADSMNNGGDHSDCGAHTTESMNLIYVSYDFSCIIH